MARKPLAKHGRSESLNLKYSKNQSPQSHGFGGHPKFSGGGDFVRSGSGGVADALAQMSKPANRG